MTPGLFVCLAFYAANMGADPPSKNPVPIVPQTVDQIIKSRVSQQLEARHPGLKVLFDQDQNCVEKASYNYTLDSLVLVGEGLLFNGRFEKSISEIIDGKEFDLSHVLPDLPRETRAVSSQGVPSPGKASGHSGLVWTAAGIGVGLLSFFVIRNLNSSESPPFTVH